MSSATVTTLTRPPKTGTKGTPPAETAPTANLQKPSSSTRVQLPVQVPVDVRRAFKAHAAERDMTMSDLFLLMWEDYRSRNG